jgi:nanoRNase/pAp phosphatase (c-di-AMP/oligoRNAs hydrolase)
MVKLTPKLIVKMCNGKSVLLLTHDNADLDTFCSAAIMQRYLQKKKIKSSVGIPSHINDQAEHFAFSEKVSFQVNPNLQEFDLVMLFDLNSFDQLGKIRKSFEDLLLSKQFSVIVFDHHVSEKNSIVRFGHKVIKEDAASTTEVLYNFLDTFDNKMSFWNCIGILEDTGHFLVGDEETFSSFAQCLKDSKKNYSQVLSFSKHKIPDDERVAFLKAAQRAQIQKIGGAIVVTSELSFYQSAAASKLLDFGANISLVAGNERTGLTTLSARAETEFKEKFNFNLVRDLLIPLQKQIGGDVGGHSGAAQWKGKALPFEVINESVSILKIFFEKK